MGFSNILATICAVASALTAVFTFIIFRRNSTPKIKLEIINKEPLHIDGLTLFRNFFYLDEKQKNALIHIEIENYSSMPGTITDMFVRTKGIPYPSQVMTSYKEYNIGPIDIRLGNRLEHYNEEYQSLKQPIRVNPYGYLIGFAFVPYYNINTNSDTVEATLDYKIAGINKTYHQKVTLYRTRIKPVDILIP